MLYSIVFRTSANKDLLALTPVHRIRIKTAIDALALTPRPAGYKALKGGQGRFRIRVGAYRVVYEIKDQILTILIVGIGHRREIYR